MSNRRTQSASRPSRNASALGRVSCGRQLFVALSGRSYSHEVFRESIRVFHEGAPTVPLVAMSGYAFANLDSPVPDFLRMALELGAARCLRKPFTPGALLAVVNEFLAEARSGFSGVARSN